MPNSLNLSEPFQQSRLFIDSNQEKFRNQLFDLLRIPSISSDSTQIDAMSECAELVQKLMVDSGLKAEILPTEGHPVVYGERIGSSGGPSLLVYGHYDVQPVEPLKDWRNDPFDPVVENDSVVARGATDDKGQSFALLCGVRAAIECGVGEDVTIKVLIEGEEEVGSPSLIPFMRQEKERLKADVVVIADSPQLDRDIPAITYGLRGIQCLEVIVRGARRDLHSGSYGGAVPNPANILARLLNACQGPFGKIAIPHFYDDVRPLEDWEREAYRKLPFDEEAFRQDLGILKLWGEEGFSTLERRWARPTFDINGLVSGHSGEGVKTVLPCEARAKFSMRLVPDQDPEKIARHTEEFILSMAPDSVSVEFIRNHGAEPVLVSRDQKALKAAEAAMTAGFGKQPVFIREGGSIPVVNTFKKELGMESLLIGLGLPDDNTHAPNEKFNLIDFQRGMVTMAALIDEISRQEGSKNY